MSDSTEQETPVIAVPAARSATRGQGRAVSAAARLGLEIRRQRMIRGLTQAEVASLIGLSARSNLSDYELGRRLPPRDLVIAIENGLSLHSGELSQRHARALVERADRWFEDSLGADS